MDSPLAVEATNIYSNEMYDYYNDEAIELLKAGVNPVQFPDLRLSVTSDESKAINDDETPKIIISASGMCEAGRIRHHLKHNLWRPDSTILFAGYQSTGTLGDKLLEGEKTIKLFGEEIQVSADILRIESFSSHADRTHLLEWVGKVKPTERAFINHGDDSVVDKFGAEVAELTGTEYTAPYSGEVWDLAKNELLEKAEVKPIIKKQMQQGSEDHKNTVNDSPAYKELKGGLDDLIKLVGRSREHSNKELKKMHADIVDLIKKYE